MNFVDEQLERQISYHLDGELDADRQVDLYRRLLREPDARRMLDAYQQTDAEAGEALRALLTAPRPSQVDPPVRVKRPGKRRVLPWGQILATAACVALAVGVGALVRVAWPVLNGEMSGPPTAMVQTQLPEADDPTAAAVDRALADADRSGGDDPMTADRRVDADHEAADHRTVEGTAWWRRPAASPVQGGRLVDREVAAPLINGPRDAQRLTDRSVVGFYDPGKQAVYLIEVDRHRTAIESTGSEL